MKEITKIAEKLNIKELIPYGKYMAKINDKKHQSQKGKLILVTSINPTPSGEGKTTLSIGINDSLNKLGFNAIACLREPSLGPVFGRKGGAIGGGKSILEPSVDINLHFTGDFHAITSANNLICAVVDNHIYQGNELGIDKVTIKRCIDMNDRSLREDFVITPASDIMAILCLSKDIEDLKRRISKMVVGYTKENKKITVKDLHIEEAATILLKDAIKPNLVQTKYGNPVIVHGGPFANIAQGTSSVIGTKLGLSLADYVITEAGFGSDLGGIKFFDIKCKNNNLYPDAVVLNTTVQALKYNGDNNLEKGISNLEFHIENMSKYTSNLLVAINKFDNDLEEELEYIKSFCNKKGIKAYVCTMFRDGEDGCIELAQALAELPTNKKRYTIYNKDDSLIEKINKVCINELKAQKVELNGKLLKELNSLPQDFDVCISKTPMSISDNAKLLGYPKGYIAKVTNITVNYGIKLVTIHLGNALTMPGLIKDSNYLNMKIEEDIISGIR